MASLVGSAKNGLLGANTTNQDGSNPKKTNGPRSLLAGCDGMGKHCSNTETRHYMVNGSRASSSFVQGTSE